jgi:hypothetical protein
LKSHAVTKFANESVKRTRPAETQLAYKLKYAYSKGGLRERSRDFTGNRIRDPSVKFPGTIRNVQNTVRDKVGLGFLI